MFYKRFITYISSDLCSSLDSSSSYRQVESRVPNSIICVMQAHCRNLADKFKTIHSYQTSALGADFLLVLRPNPLAKIMATETSDSVYEAEEGC